MGDTGQGKGGKGKATGAAVEGRAQSPAAPAATKSTANGIVAPNGRRATHSDVAFMLERPAAEIGKLTSKDRGSIISMLHSITEQHPELPSALPTRKAFVSYHDSMSPHFKQPIAVKRARLAEYAAKATALKAEWTAAK